jgi:hypothetical protein
MVTKNFSRERVHQVGKMHFYVVPLFLSQVLPFAMLFAKIRISHSDGPFGIGCGDSILP